MPHSQYHIKINIIVGKTFRKNVAHFLQPNLANLLNAETSEGWLSIPNNVTPVALKACKCFLFQCQLLLNGQFSGKPWLVSYPRFLPPFVVEENLRALVYCTGQISFLSHNQQHWSSIEHSKHRRQPQEITNRPCPFFIHHWTPELSGIAPLMLAVRRKYHTSIHCIKMQWRKTKLIQLLFYVPPDTKWVISETFFPANLLA